MEKKVGGQYALTCLATYLTKVSSVVNRALFFSNTFHCAASLTFLISTPFN